MQTNELLPSVCQFISEIEKKSSVFQCSFYQNFNFTAVKISFLKQFRELTNDTMMWDNINWQCRWNQTCEEAIWCMETIPVIRRLQLRKFHESHLQSILPAEAPTSCTTAAVAPTSCTTAAVAPTSCTTPAVAPTSSTTPPEALTSSTKPLEAVSRRLVLLQVMMMPSLMELGVLRIVSLKKLEVLLSWSWNPCQECFAAIENLSPLQAKQMPMFSMSHSDELTYN